MSDNPHADLLSSVVYALDDCTAKVHNPDGTTRDLKNTAGGASSGPITPHTAENTSIRIVEHFLSQ